MRSVVACIILLISCAASVTAQTYKAWVKAGDEAVEQRQYAAAIQYYFKAAEFETEDSELQYKTANVLRLYNDYDKAAVWYTKIVLNDKDNRYPDALFYLAEMRKYTGQYKEAGLLFEKYVSLHAGDSTYFTAKGKFEAATMEQAAAIADSTSDRKISQAPAPVNSIYSDYAGMTLGDSVFQFSSLRFLFENTDKKNQGYYVTRIMETPAGKNTPKPLPISINQPELHNSNTAVSPDHKLMVFSRCPEAGDYRLQCQLYESVFTNGAWSKPVALDTTINLEGYTATQPAITTNGADGYILYFVSDRPGGQGKLDIWKANRSTSGKYDTPENPGSPVNTFDDELTPYFDAVQQALYFSSYGHPGMGGFDVYKSKLEGGQLATPENLLPPVNSAANDIYFTLTADTLKGSFSSNRKGSMYIGSQTCCYDIYHFSTEVREPEPSADTTAIVSAVTDLRKRAAYDDFLPLVLFFENDYPDPRSRKETTNANYEELYKDYIDHRAEYLSEFTKNLEATPRATAAQAIETFFNDSVTASYNRLVEFCDKLDKAMNDSIQLVLEVRGRASPLAKTEYNRILSKRRIASLNNYLKSYKNGVLLPFIESGQLVLKEVPAGESLATANISDDLKDKRNSVYNPNAASERRIELINVVITDLKKSE